MRALARRRRGSGFALMGLVMAVLLAAGCESGGTRQPTPADSRRATASVSLSPSPGGGGSATSGQNRLKPTVLVAAGDIACNPADPYFNSQRGIPAHCQQRATSKLIGPLHPSAVMPLGDTQYQRGTYSGYLGSYAPTWGRYLSITHPVLGNHEFKTPKAQGYFPYFGAAAGDPDKGYYSYELGAWHIVVLNSACRPAGGCGAGSAQERWLKSDLAAHPTRCTLAAWHVPRWSSGEHGSNPAFDDFWRDLFDAGADVVLNGHDHDYERFAPLGPDGEVDLKGGIREFVVGTGGVGLRPIRNRANGSEIREDGTFGVLALTLTAVGYDWRFASVGSDFTDSGHSDCT